ACFKWLAEFVCGREIPDINSGLRVMRRGMGLRFAGAPCGGFSFTTTLTLVAILNYRFGDFHPIAFAPPLRQSHIPYLRHTLRTAQILVMTILTFNPIKLYMLYALFVLGLGAVAVGLYALVPAIREGILLASLFVLSACLLMGGGFLAEQRRAGAINILEDP